MAVSRNGTTVDPQIFLELGSTGLQRSGGSISEEYARELIGLRGIKTYTRMQDDDTIGAVLYANEVLLRQVGWQVQPSDETPAAVEAAEFVDGCLMHDMSQSWDNFIGEILSFQLYGWSFAEICYKRRTGDVPPPGYDRQDPAWDWWAPSRYDDGKIGLRKLPIRSQDTLLRWEFDRGGGVRAMAQHDLAATKTAIIPIEKALLFRLFSHKGNPEGRSLVRAAYVDYFYKQNIRRIEGIGIERDLAGLPCFGVPPSWLGSEASPQEVENREYTKRVGRNIRNDEEACLVYPLSYDEHGNQQFKFELASTGGARAFNTSEILQRYDTRILQSMLANILMVGMQGVGAYSLGESLGDLYALGLTTILDAIAEVLNRHLLPRLWVLNAFPRETMPLLGHGKVKHVNWSEFTTGIQRLSQSGFVFSDADIAYVRSELGMPEAQEDKETL